MLGWGEVYVGGQGRDDHNTTDTSTEWIDVCIEMGQPATNEKWEKIRKREGCKIE